jgi:hypothetical protein
MAAFTGFVIPHAELYDVHSGILFDVSANVTV